MRGFSESERERIREALLDAGRDLFSQYGLDRTYVKDITDEVGIGTGTFYQFYDSKELLYAEVLLRESNCLKAEIDSAVEQLDDPHEQARTTLRMVFQGVESNPLLSRLIIDGELRTLQHQLSESERQVIIEEMNHNLLGHTDEWVALDSFKHDDPMVVEGLLRALVFVTRWKATASTRDVQYDDVRDFLIDVVADGLFECED